MKINNPKISKILKVEISFSVLKLMYLSKIVLNCEQTWSDVENVLLKSKKKLIIKQKPFVLWSLIRSTLLGHMVFITLLPFAN